MKNSKPNNRNRFSHKQERKLLIVLRNKGTRACEFYGNSYFTEFKNACVKSSDMHFVILYGNGS